MNKKILGIFIAVLAVALFTLPVMAKPTDAPVSYDIKQTGMDPVDWNFVGKDHSEPMTGSVFIVKESVRRGIINVTGTETIVFNYVQTGSMKYNINTGKQVWRLKHVWTSTTVDGGFKGTLNGEAGRDSQFIVSGNLLGFGDLNGQKLIVEFSADTRLITGTLVTK
ncbi:hypothetical protein ACFLRN_09900 [Thermoproteota archaeon]